MGHVILLRRNVRTGFYHINLLYMSSIVNARKQALALIMVAVVVAIREVYINGHCGYWIAGLVDFIINFF